jgi:murein endopeptidase
MLEPIESTKYKNYYKLPPNTLGIQQGPWHKSSRIWGRKPTIEFLINLGWWWDFSWNPYDKYPQSTICIGDISPEGGASTAPGRDPVEPHHSTHKNGHDVDIFFVRNDGMAKPTSCLIKDKATYDLEQTIRLGKMMVKFADRLGLRIGFFYGNDGKFQGEIRGITTFRNHEDHFHINLVHPSEVQAKYRK